MLAAPYAYGAGFGGYGAYPAAYGYGAGAYGLGWFNQQHGQQGHPGMTNLAMQPGFDLQEQNKFTDGAKKMWGKTKAFGKKAYGVVKTGVHKLDGVSQKYGSWACDGVNMVKAGAGAACNTARAGLHKADAWLQKHLQQQQLMAMQ